MKLNRAPALFVAAALSLAAIGQAYAHYVYTLSGWRYHSVGCAVALKNVPNQDKFPGKVTCNISPTTQATVYCAVPGNDYTFAGNAAIQPVTATTTLAASALEKSSGGTYVAEVRAFNPVLSDYIGACPNKNWSVVAVVLTQFDSSILIHDSSNVLATRIDASCVIPPQYQNSVPPAGAQYVCNATAQHVS